MTTGTRFVDDEELVGKTIECVRADDYSCDILFTDGTYTSIVFGGGYYVGEGSYLFRELDPPSLELLDAQLEDFVRD